MQRVFLRALVVLLLVLPLARVATTWRVFSQIVDEPLHIAGGFQWLHDRRYDINLEHPPLARIGFGLVAWLQDAEMPFADWVTQGNALLHRHGRYEWNLAAARAGNLPWLLLALAVVAIWSRRLLGGPAALVALVLFGSLPAVLGHAGVATTDMAAAAIVIAALFLFARWIEEPSWANALWLALICGAGLLAKFSFVAFFPAAAMAMLLAMRPSGVWRRRISQSLAIAATTALLVWGGYHFSMDRWSDWCARLPAGEPRRVASEYATVAGYEWVRSDLLHRYYEFTRDARRPDIDFVDWAKAAGYPSPLAGRHGDTMRNAPPVPRPGVIDTLLEPFRIAWHWVRQRVPVPAPQFFHGIELVRDHSRYGHPAFLLGQYGDYGWWYYFPVVLFFKTPLAFVALMLAGLVLLLKNGTAEMRAVALAPVALLVPAMAASINIGVRHVLPVYPLLAIAAAFAVVTLWRRGAAGRVAAALLVSWQLIAGAAAHPDYLAYFNEFAGEHPERIAVDSNLDWGQDLLRLRDFVEENDIELLHLAYFGTADWGRHLPNAAGLPRGTPVKGWIAISVMQRVSNRGEGYRWLDSHRPVQRIGKSIDVYRVD